MPSCPSCNEDIGIMDKLFFNQLQFIICKSCGQKLNHKYFSNILSGVLVAVLFVCVSLAWFAPKNGFAQLCLIVSIMALFAQRYWAPLKVVGDN